MLSSSFGGKKIIITLTPELIINLEEFERGKEKCEEYEVGVSGV